MCEGCAEREMDSDKWYKKEELVASRKENVKLENDSQGGRLFHDGLDEIKGDARREDRPAWWEVDRKEEEEWEGREHCDLGCRAQGARSKEPGR